MAVQGAAEPFVSRRRNEATARRALGAVQGAHAERVARWEAPSRSFLLPSAERALGSVPEPFASVVRLVDLEEHSYAEAADRARRAGGHGDELA